MGSVVGTTVFCSPAPGPFGVLSGPLVGHPDVNLKQVDCQVFLQQRWIYSGSAENCSSESATMVSHMQVPYCKGQRKLLQRWGKEAGRAVEKSPRLFIGLVLSRKDGESFFLLDSAMVSGCELFWSFSSM